ncbi:hypothetical protein Dsin_028019 [Dipteronia sinensis]|uniref:Large ribosomal subunit protein uL4m n=1 Tax=Dipteronia sinensis TaxID=43782 RepID=A0AAD9ZPK1_9ROSI|nr:hypothetical protein Dsin_028019 [Dipteronia sinensis]
MHGPNPRSHAIKVNKKVRRLGLKVALTARAAEEKASLSPSPSPSHAFVNFNVFSPLGTFPFIPTQVPKLCILHIMAHVFFSLFSIISIFHFPCVNGRLLHT